MGNHRNRKLRQLEILQAKNAEVAVRTGDMEVQEEVVVTAVEIPEEAQPEEQPEPEMEASDNNTVEEDEVVEESNEDVDLSELTDEELQARAVELGVADDERLVSVDDLVDDNLKDDLEMIAKNEGAEFDSSDTKAVIATSIRRNRLIKVLSEV